jgi:phospholipid/cholesterol/gamma-HCH transport system permease protein
MQEKKSIVLPEKFSIDKVPGVANEIKRLTKDQLIEIDLKNTRAFDSSGIAFINYLKGNYKNVSFKNLKPEFEKVFSMFSPVEKADDEKVKGHETTIRRGITRFKHTVGLGVETLGTRFLAFLKNSKTFLVLLADEIYYIIQYLLKRRGIYPGEIWNQLFFMAYKSYPIVSLISFLVGVTIAITSAEQLRSFGADIYLANLVGFGMIRELVPLMTGIILAGKIGASITAEISSMKVLEETDALKTMGIVPEKFLMVPRLIAISLTIPLLVAIADFIAVTFYDQMMEAVDLTDFLIGQGKTLVFGWIVVISSGYKGFSVKRGAVGVGIATTESVVLSISLIIIFDCIFALMLY